MTHHPIGKLITKINKILPRSKSGEIITSIVYHLDKTEDEAVNATAKKCLEVLEKEKGTWCRRHDGFTALEQAQKEISKMIHE